MNTPGTLPDHERRRFPRYYVNTRLTLAIEDESLKESIGIGEPVGSAFVIFLLAPTSGLAINWACC